MALIVFQGETGIAKVTMQSCIFSVNSCPTCFKLCMVATAYISTTSHYNLRFVTLPEARSRVECPGNINTLNKLDLWYDDL